MTDNNAPKPTYLYVDEWRLKFRMQNAKEFDYVAPFTESFTNALPDNFYQVVQDEWLQKLAQKSEKEQLI